MTNTKYTTLEQSQRLKEIGFSAEADGWWNGSLELEGYYEYWIDQLEDKPLGIYNRAVYRTCPSYRLDTLLLALPEWAFEGEDKEIDLDYFCLKTRGHRVENDDDFKFTYTGKKLLIRMVFTRGPQAIAAAVDLICLLKEVEDGK